MAISSRYKGYKLNIYRYIGYILIDYKFQILKTINNIKYKIITWNMT